jgi:ATP-dependent Clp protease ATP-binding subunit ClpC
MPAFFGPGGYGSNDFDDFLGRVFGQGGEQGRPVRRIDLTKTMTQQALQLVSEAGRDAAERGHGELDALHLLLAVAKAEPGRALLKNAGADPDAVAKAVEQQLPASQTGQGGQTAEQPNSLTPAAQRVLINAHQIARTFGSTYIAPEHLVLAMVANQEAVPGRLLAQHGVTPESLQQAAANQPQQGGGQTGSSETPTLDQYGWDLTKQARDGGIDPVIGRGQEIEQTLEVLSRRTKNNPVLLGEAGVGKTAIVEGIASRIASGDVPELLREKRIVQLNISGMLAGTRYRGDFEERMNKVIDEITEHSDELIVFLDEVHTVVGAGGAEGSVDAGNMLKPRLARGELHIIGATTLDEYRKKIESDAALERRFQPVHVDEPSVEDSVAILHGLREAYQSHHKVRYTDDAVTAAVELSDRYVTDRQLPDKAIDLLDQAGARKRLHRVGSGSGRAELQQQLSDRTREKDEAVQAEDY